MYNINNLTARIITAIDNGHPELDKLIKTSVAQGANLCYIMNSTGFSLLHIAAIQSAALEVFVTAAPVVQEQLLNWQDHSGQTALHKAIKYNQTANALYLLNLGAKADITDKDGLTALSLAAKFGNDTVINKIIACCTYSNIDQADVTKAITLALQRNFGEVTEILQEYNPNPGTDKILPQSTTKLANNLNKISDFDSQYDIYTPDLVGCSSTNN